MLATAGLKSDENLIAKLPHAGTANSIPERQDITFPSELGHRGFRSGRWRSKQGDVAVGDGDAFEAGLNAAATVR